ncbi:hypothetical protein GNF82_18785 [Clostridium perfringens]
MPDKMIPDQTGARATPHHPVPILHGSGLYGKDHVRHLPESAPQAAQEPTGEAVLGR